MTTHQRPPVDLDMLTMALQAHDLEAGWWLDCDTGEVILAPESDDTAQDKKICQARANNPDRYMDIEPLPVSLMRDLMEGFVCTINDAHFCQQLRKALEKQQYQYHFKAVLAEQPRHEDDWYRFKEDFYALQARQWIRDRELTFEVRQPDGASSPSTLIEKTAIPVNVRMTIEIYEHHGGSMIRSYQLVDADHDSLRVRASEIRAGHQEILTEADLNEYQKAAIEQLLEQFRLREISGLGADNKGSELVQGFIHLRIGPGDQSAEIKIRRIKGTWLDQLVNQLGFILGLPLV